MSLPLVTSTPCFPYHTLRLVRASSGAAQLFWAVSLSYTGLTATSGRGRDCGEWTKPAERAHSTCLTEHVV